MAKRLLKRTTQEAPKPLPARNREIEPETTVGKEPVNVAGKVEPTLGRCRICKVMPAHSETDHLCLGCHKEAAGYEFDSNKMRYVKIKGGK